MCGYRTIIYTVPMPIVCRSFCVPLSANFLLKYSDTSNWKRKLEKHDAQTTSKKRNRDMVQEQ